MLIDWSDERNDDFTEEVIEVILEVNKFKVVKANLTRSRKASVEDAEFEFFNFFKNDEEMMNMVKTVVKDHLINSGGKEIIEFAFIDQDKSGNEYAENTVKLVQGLMEDEFKSQLSDADIMDVVESYAYAHGIDVLELDEDYLTDPYGRIEVSLKQFLDWVNSVKS